MCADQNPMGMPIKRPYKPDQQVEQDTIHKAQTKVNTDTDE